MTPTVRDYFILTAQPHPDSCVLDRYPAHFEHIWQATEGVLLGGRYPSRPLRFEMSRRVGGKRLLDCIENTLGYLIVSEIVREVLEAQATTAIEFLPIQLVNHKGRMEPRRFFITNVLGQVDCIALARSRYEESALRPGELCDLTTLALAPEQVDPERNIFRLARRPRVILIREDLASALRQSGVQGLAFLPLGTEVSL